MHSASIFCEILSPLTCWLHFTNLFCFHLPLPGNNEPRPALEGNDAFWARPTFLQWLKTSVRTVGDACNDANLLNWLQ